MNINQSREASDKGVHSLLTYLLSTVNSSCETFQDFPGIKIGGHMVNSIRYADDMVLIASIIDRARFQDLWPKKWLSVMNLIRFDRCVMVYKIVNKHCPESLWNMFQQRCSISNYNTRNYRDLHIPRLNLELTKKGFYYSGSKAWNDIPVNIRELPSLRLFKTHLKRHLMSLDN